ncbi:response regulator [Modestobacter sp. I12A-02662]|uniref:response regulator n=1 Tax=Modestobacter sp. I12A-02662 TaxID=1730496 RepID=UPI0034DE6456
MTIRVALVDDQELVRTGLAMVVDSADGIEVVAQAADGAEAVAVLATTPVDVVLMDVQMPYLDGIEATARLTARAPGTRVIVLTTFDLDEYAVAGLRAGASGFLLKDASAEAVVQAIRTVHAGDAVLAPHTIRRMVGHLASASGSPAASPALDQLTDREREVLLELAQGRSNLEIARRLFLTESTVKTHVRHVLAKLGVRDRVQAVIFAYEHGLVRPG